MWPWHLWIHHHPSELRCASQQTSRRHPLAQRWQRELPRPPLPPCSARPARPPSSRMVPLLPSHPSRRWQPASRPSLYRLVPPPLNPAPPPPPPNPARRCPRPPTPAATQPGPAQPALPAPEGSPLRPGCRSHTLQPEAPAPAQANAKGSAATSLWPLHRPRPLTEGCSPLPCPPHLHCRPNAGGQRRLHTRHQGPHGGLVPAPQGAPPCRSPAAAAWRHCPHPALEVSPPCQSGSAASGDGLGGFPETGDKQGSGLGPDQTCGRGRERVRGRRQTVGGN